MLKKIEKYYLEKFGEPTRKAVFAPKIGSSISILKWNKESTNEGVDMYCTLGASEYYGNNKKTCEFFIGINPDVEKLIDAIAEVSIGDGSLNNVPNSGDSITLPFPLWKNSFFKTFLFREGKGIISNIKIDNKEISFIKLVPIFQNELEYKKLFGENALWEIFKKNQTPYWNSERKEIGIM